MFDNFIKELLLMKIILLLTKICYESGEIVPLACRVGADVNFGCPCCHGQMNSCRFKKLFLGGFIAYDGTLNAEFPRFEINRNKTGIKLKGCTKEDEGTFVWMCGGCNLNNQFKLEIYQESRGYVADEPVHLGEETFHLDCQLGSSVHFKCPCPGKIESCRFESELKVIALKSSLLANVKFEFDEKYTGITLNKCEDKDEGVYDWICPECHKKRKFLLKTVADPVMKPEIGHAPESLSFTSELNINGVWIVAILSFCISSTLIFAIYFYIKCLGRPYKSWLSCSNDVMMTPSVHQSERHKFHPISFLHH